MSSEFHSHYAYGRDRAVIETVMRAHAVKRRHMIDTTRQQTLAEHSANVALLVYAVATTTPGMFFGPAFTAAAIALLHDLDEVFVGDIPTPTKKHLSGLQELEYRTLPREFRPAAKPDPNVTLLIKICDLADGIRFIRLHGVDITAQHARIGLEEQLNLKYEDTFDWPVEVAKHVRQQVMFYAYENH